MLIFVLISIGVVMFFCWLFEEHGDEIFGCIKGVFAVLLILGVIVGIIFGARYGWESWQVRQELRRVEEYKEEQRKEELRKREQEKYEREKIVLQARERQEMRNAQQEKARREKIAKIQALVDNYFNEYSKVDEFFLLHAELAEIRAFKQKLQTSCREQTEQCYRLKTALNGQNKNYLEDERFLKLRKKLNSSIFLWSKSEAMMRECYLDYLTGISLGEIVKKSEMYYSELNKASSSDYKIENRFSLEKQVSAAKTSSIDELFDAQALAMRALSTTNEKEILMCCVKLRNDQEVLLSLVKNPKASEIARVIAERVFQIAQKNFSNTEN